MAEPTIFAFIREGTSDDGLIPHLRELLVRAGRAEVIGSAREYRGTTEDRLRQVLSEDARVDVVFVHRDADGRHAEHRRTEILDAAGKVAELDAAVVPVVPIQELEAWLLLDEMAIRRVVGRPSGKDLLGLPKPKHIEQTADPKAILKAACLSASGTKGRRHKEESRRFSERRRVLLERLDIDGPVSDLPAWQAMEADVSRAVASLVAKQ